MADLGATLRDVFGGTPPDLIGLCEVGDRALATAVGRVVAKARYASTWSGPPPTGETAIVLLYDPSKVLPTGAPQETGPKLPSGAGTTPSSAGQRARWLGIELQLQFGSRAAFWCVTCHWKSLFGQGEWASDPDRMQSAREIGDLFLRAFASTPNMMVFGDMNCEPGDRPLKSQELLDPQGVRRPNQLRAFRHHRRVLRDNKKLAYFYNPMWRWMGEPDAFEVAGRPGYTPPRTTGTHGSGLSGGSEWLMFDQLLVTKRLLRGGQMTLRESSLRIVPPVSGCSDHCAIGVEFDCG